MAIYKQEPKHMFDQMTYDTLKSLADDYRRQAKLMDLRQKSGVDSVKQKLNTLKKNFRDKKLAEEKAAR